MAGYDIGPRLGIDGEKEFRQAITRAQNSIRTMGIEMQIVTEKFDKNDKSQEKLTSQNKVLNKQINAHKRLLKDLNAGLEHAQKNYGENHSKTEKWRQSVLYATRNLMRLEKSVKDNNEALADATEEAIGFRKKIDDAGESVGKTEGKLKGFTDGLKKIGGGIGKAAIGAIVAIGAAAIGAAKGLVNLVESTREYRLDMSKLDQNIKDSNLNYDEMKGHVSELTALTGELDSSVEAVSNLMAIGFDKNEITSAVDALSGAVIRFPDTLKIEGLADGLQETIATGKAIGPFAELIDRLGGDVEEFNTQMAGATTEAEKQQVALDFLAKSGLAEVSAEYKEANEEMLGAAKAQQEFDDAMAGVAAAVEPALASIKIGAAGVLTSLIEMATGSESSAEDFKANIDGLIESVTGQIENLIPIISTTAEALIPALIEGIVVALPQLIEASMTLLDTIINSIIDNLPMIIDAAVLLTVMLLKGIIKSLPLLAKGAIEIIIALAEGLAEAYPELIPAIIGAVLTIVQGLLDNLPLLIDAAIQLVLGIVEGLIEAIPLLLEAAPVLIESLVGGLMKAGPMLLEAAIDLILALVEFMTTPDNIVMLVTMSLDLIDAIAAGLISAIPEMVAVVPEILASLSEAFLDRDWLQIGKDIINGIKDGIKESAGNLARAAVNAAKGAIESIKGPKGVDINSPSKKAKDEVGLMIGYGIAEGILESQKAIDAAMMEVSQKVKVDASFNSGQNGISNYSTNDNRRVFNTKVEVNGGGDGLDWERKVNKMIIQQSTLAYS